MKYKRLGKTGLYLPVIGVGAGQFGDIYGETTQQNVNETVVMAIDNGINYFDSAPSYGPEGLGETRLGEAIRGKYRGGLIIATKFGRWDHGRIGKPVYDYDFSPKRVRAELENSLRRLGTDYVDMYLAHDVNNCKYLDYIVEYTMPEIEKLRQEGKLRFTGVTGVYSDTLKYIADRSKSVDVVLSFGRYNLVDTSLKGYFAENLKQGLGLINAAVLYVGVLTHNNHTLMQWREKENLAGMRAAVQKAVELCEKAGTTLPEQACLFALAYDEPASTLIGMGRPSSLKRNLEMLDKPRNIELEQELLELFRGTAIFPEKGEENGISLTGVWTPNQE